jgi:hypothetical protein
MGRSFLSKTVVEGEIMQWTPEEKKETSSRYGCEILFERTNLSQVKDSSLPNDAYLVFYCVNNETYMDLCRGKKVKIFDMYYDKFGPGSVQKIDFGYGRVSPRMWGYKAPDGKKKK